MGWVLKILRSSLGKKIIMALTGLLLIGFVVTHLAGNLLIYLGADYYDNYAHALHASPLLPLAELGLLLLFLAHIGIAVVTVRDNRRARPQAYAVKRSKQGQSTWTASAIMAVSGAIILAFILLHLADFRFNLRLPGPSDELPSVRAIRILHDPITELVYFVGSLFLGYHLWHGFQSLFQSLGLRHPKYTPLIEKLGGILALLLGLGFASFPAWIFIKKLGGN